MFRSRRSSTATTKDHSQKRNPCFDPVGAPPRPPRTIVKISFGLEVLNLPPDIQEILQHLRMRCRWPKILLATVVKLISLLDKIVTGAQMGVISLIMRGVLYIKRKRFCRGDPVEMDHHNLQCSPSLIKIFQRSTA
ncbi:hypothetical protein IGI04_020020 [Brassica rapa subsp. trilocularis]|uniref:Uncharacterized protein n=1 Tax=Brassica rapa subsp. trilocularis TaxID=1813537 RepID=A0ABQ7MHJ4_BRACM|nr:hypothetical protein IGI04_021948 [Brassica rapa subsp. trilocularis]KAG5398206.1 hypothetical protein IGI04_020020 [Brassica rapa subsp. trilocularis]